MKNAKVHKVMLLVTLLLMGYISYFIVGLLFYQLEGLDEWAAKARRGDSLLLLACNSFLCYYASVIWALIKSLK